MRCDLLVKGIVFTLLFLPSSQIPLVAHRQNQSMFHSEVQRTDVASRIAMDALIRSDPIIIDGDEDFAGRGFPGSGTEADPYIIESLHINLNETHTNWAIRIRYTTSHFEIRNCLLQGENYWEYGFDFYEGEGIDLRDVANACIFNNTFLYTYSGIAIYNSENITIEENYFPGVISETTGVLGIRISGYYFGSCNNTYIRRNILENCDLGIKCEFGIHFNISENILVNSSGISANWVNQSVIMSNSVENGGYGISMQGVHSNLIVENNLTRCSTGIYVMVGFDCIIEYNICTENGIEIVRGSEGGIILQSYTSHINVTWNKLIDNIRNALDNGEDNLFQYNYWSDYNGTDANGDGIGDVPYEILGDANNVDPFPIVLNSAAYPDLIVFIIVGFGGVVIVSIIILFLEKR